MKILTTSNSKNFASALQKVLNIDILAVEIKKFANGEKKIRIKEKFIGEKIILISSLSYNPDEMILETLLLADAANRGGALEINLVIPYLGYSLQDQVFLSGEALSSKVVANVFSHSEIFKKIFLFDLHNFSVVGFFSLPTYHLNSLNFFYRYVADNFSSSFDNNVISSPDFGGLKKARRLAEKLAWNLVYVDKKRNLETGQVTINSFFGQVKNKNVFILDDIIISGQTAISLCESMKNAGALNVYFLATHGLFVKNSINVLNQSPIDQIIITNTIDNQNLPDKFKILDLSNYFVQHFSQLF